MAVIKGNSRQSTSVQRVSEGAEVYLRMLRDGALVGTNWKQAGVFQGLGFMVNVGSFTDPQVGGGNGTAVDEDQPELAISVPTGTSIMPIRIEVVGKVPLLANDADECDVILAVDKDVDSLAGTTATATKETIFNMNTNKGSGSVCAVYSACSVVMTTAPTHDLELAHVQITGDVQGTAATALWTPLYLLYNPDPAPVLNGPCTLFVYWGGTVATSCFAAAQWLEFPTSFSTI